MAEENQASGGRPPMASVLERNMQALLAKLQEEERSRSAQDRVADAVTRRRLHLWFPLWIGRTRCPSE